MRHSSGLALVILVCNLGCSDPSSDKSNVDVTGKWCGADVGSATACEGDEIEYLEIAQSASVVTGRACEAFEKECYDVQGGSLTDDQLEFFYTFSGYRVDALLKVINGTLTGSYLSDKCGCALPVTFHRVN